MNNAEEFKSTRTSNVIRNVWTGLVCQLLILIFSFANRTIFIKMLGNDYLSINGLFSNILNMISFVELGFGTALIYMLYKPVADNNIEKTQSIIKFYKKTYTLIGTVMFFIGILVIPFMNLIIKEPPAIKENLYIIYILYLTNTCIGYFFFHKTAIINANQQNYIVTIYNQIGKLIQSLLQIGFLILTKEYILYLLIQLVMTITSNILISIKANKMYPYLKEKNVISLTKEEKNTIISKVKSLVFYRISPAILNGTDNLIMSSYIGLSSVGIYSNYYLITNYILLFLNQITSAFETSVGNLNVKEKEEQKENVFYKIVYICFLLYGIVCILLMATINDFINIWLGKEYVFSGFIVFTIVLYLYIDGLHFPSYSYRTTAALFDKAKMMPLIEVVLNIVVSIVLAKYIGISGVFLGTSISKILTFFWSDPKLLYKYLFKSHNLKLYYQKYFYYLFITLITGGLMYKLSILFPVSNYLTWFIRSCIMCILTILIFYLFTFKMSECQEIKYIIKESIKKIKLKIFQKNH